jgi:hypothetical protein
MCLFLYSHHLEVNEQQYSYMMFSAICCQQMKTSISLSCFANWLHLISVNWFTLYRYFILWHHIHTMYIYVSMQ